MPINKTIASEIDNLPKADVFETEAKKRAGLLTEAMSHTDGNLIRALDIMLADDPILRNEWNNEAQKRNAVLANYPLVAQNIKETDPDGYKRAGGIMDTITNPGGANYLQTTVADFVAQTIDRNAVVLPTVTSFDIPAQGDLKIPVINDFQTISPIAEDADATNITTTLEGNTSSITISPQRMAAQLLLSKLFMTKITGKNIQNVLASLGSIMARSIDRQILLGNGSGLNFVGMAQNATAVTFAGDIYESICNAIAALRKGTSQVTIYMNQQAKMEVLKLHRKLQNDRINVVDITNGKLSIATCPVVETDVIDTTGSAGARATQIILGYSNQFYMGMSEQPAVTSSKEFNFAKSVETVKIETVANGKVAFNDAFAKIALTNLP